MALLSSPFLPQVVVATTDLEFLDTARCLCISVLNWGTVNR